MQLPKEKNVWTKIYDHSDSIRELQKSDRGQVFFNFCICLFVVIYSVVDSYTDAKYRQVNSGNTQELLQQSRTGDADPSFGDSDILN